MVNDRSVLGSDVELPSRGLPYEGKLPGTVRVTPWTTREQMLLSGSNASHSLQAINSLLDACVPDLAQAGMKSLDLVTADRVFLLITARTLSHGSEYHVRARCTACSAQVPHTYRLPDDMEIRSLPDEWQPTFVANLPISGASVELRLLRGHDELDVERYKETLIRKAQEEIVGDPTHSYRVARSIVSVRLPNGTVMENNTAGDIGQIKEWYAGLIAGDSDEIRFTIDENDCGLDTQVQISCPNCNNSFYSAIPMSLEFFRPDRRRKSHHGRKMDTNPHRRSDVGGGGTNVPMGETTPTNETQGGEGQGARGGDAEAGAGQHPAEPVSG